MPKTLPLLALLFPVFVLTAAPEITTKDLVNTRVMVLGDSITQAGTWVSFVQYHLLKAHPQAKVDVISIGLGSETTSGLTEGDHPFPRPCVHERLERALKAVQPKVVVACYGMNDGIYHPASPERDQAFRDGINKLISVSRAHGVDKVFLLTPPTYGGTKAITKPPFGYKTPYVHYNNVLAGYAKWIMSIRQPGVYSANIHTPLHNYEMERRKAEPKFRLAKDGVHPQLFGHFIMAQCLLEAIGVPRSDNPEATMATITADPLYKLANQHRSIRSKGWLPFVGYTRGRTQKTDDIGPTEAKCAELMTKIDAIRRAK